MISYGSPLSTMKSLDNDILASLAMLRRHINSLQSPIYRLPPEVVSEIAFHLQPEADLIHLSHVSYRLRAALLSQPSLWSYIDVKHEERAQAFFARSKQAPLRVNLVKDDGWRFSPPYSYRERIVSLEISKRAAQKQLVFLQPMPALRRLEIVDNEHEVEDEGFYGEGRENETSWSLQSVTLPSVTTLIVRDVTPLPLRVPHLTRFKFRDSENTTMIDELLDFLDNCPLLEDIDISYADEISSPRNQPVSLPNLRTYTQSMYGIYYNHTWFNMLSLPPSCLVTTTCRFGEYPSIEDEELEDADLVPSFQNPGYLTGITRIKLRTTHTSAGWITGALESINAKGTKVCSEIMVYPGESFRYSKRAIEDGIHNSLNSKQLGCLQGPDARSTEILCLQGCRLWDGEGKAVDAVKNASDCLRGISTLILSGTTVKPCLLALDMDPSANTGWHDILQTLLTVAQRRKAAGSPFRTVSLFLLKDPELEQVLEELEECIERFEVTVGDSILEWDVDKYFLDGLEYLREHRDIRWD